jgi:hypothetical protein
MRMILRRTAGSHMLAAKITRQILLLRNRRMITPGLRSKGRQHRWPEPEREEFSIYVTSNHSFICIIRDSHHRGDEAYAPPRDMIHVQ